MQDEAPSSRRSLAQWLSLVQAAEREGTLFKAFDLAVQGLETYPDAILLKHRAVLSLARAGATELAQRKYDELGLAAAAGDSEDVAALRARLVKDAALATAGETRRRKAAEAADLYAAIHDRYRTAYPAINAATLRLVAGDEAEARRFAKLALSELEAGSDDYYDVATAIEAHFLLGEVDKARALFPSALKANGGDHAALASTWKQLRLVLALKNLDPKLVAAEFAPARVIHFVGHLIAPSGKPGRFPAAEEAAVKRKIDDYMARAHVGSAYGSLASGADILFAEAVLRHGASLHVVLPFERGEFVDISVRPAGGEWVQRFEACLGAAATVSWATEDSYLGDDNLFAYCSQLAMGLAVLRSRHLETEVEQVAVWDGRPTAGPAGTAADVAAWQRTRLPQTIIRCGDYDGKDAGAPVADSKGRGRVIRAMLFCDIKGFSKLSDTELPHFVGTMLGTLGETVDRYDGHVQFANTWGDGLFLVFEDVGAAARCALDLQAALGRIDLRKAGLPDSMAMRIGGHLGPSYAAVDPVLKKTNYFGAHVSRAARIEPVTPPGCVYVTETFAAVLGLEHAGEFACDYVGVTEAAKHYGSMRMFLLRRTAADA